MAIVHVVCAALRPDAAEDAVAHAIELARGLRDAPGAQRSLVGRNEAQIVAVTWLEGRDALEPFAASPPHMAFIMRGLAPCIRGMWSAAVECDVAPPTSVTSVWVFALQSAETLFEWQVRDLLDLVATFPGTAASGPTVEERERYRAGGAVCLDASHAVAFDAALARARAAWGDIAPSIVEARVDLDDDAAETRA